jgi:hypothetical protein
MERICEDCGGTDFEIDVCKAEAVCEACGVVQNYIDDSADTNSSTSFGEGQQHSSVSSDGDKNLGTVMNPRGDLFDANGVRLNAAQRELARRLARYDRNIKRERDPMFRLLMTKIREMFGADIAHAVRLLAEATAKKLTPAQEAVRKTLPSSARDRLKCPKTSICRSGDGVQGESDRQNLEIMALAVVALAGKWFRTVVVNEMALMEQYGITKRQLLNAKQTITKHYKERISQGWAPLPQVMVASAARDCDLDNAVDNLVNALEPRLSVSELDRVMEGFWDAMNGLKEPSVDGPLANVDIAMVAICVICVVLERQGLLQGNLNRISNAAGLGRSGAGVKNRVKQLREQYLKGELPEAKGLFEGSDADVDEADSEGDESADA